MALPLGLLQRNQLKALLSPEGSIRTKSLLCAYLSSVHQTLDVVYSGVHYMWSPFSEGTGFTLRFVSI